MCQKEKKNKEQNTTRQPRRFDFNKAVGLRTRQTHKECNRKIKASRLYSRVTASFTALSRLEHLEKRKSNQPTTPGNLSNTQSELTKYFSFSKKNKFSISNKIFLLFKKKKTIFLVLLKPCISSLVHTNTLQYGTYHTLATCAAPQSSF